MQILLFGAMGVDVDTEPMLVQDNKLLIGENAMHDRTRARMGGVCKRRGLRRFSAVNDAAGNAVTATVMGGITAPIHGFGGAPDDGNEQGDEGADPSSGTGTGGGGGGGTVPPAAVVDWGGATTIFALGLNDSVSANANSGGRGWYLVPGDILTNPLAVAVISDTPGPPSTVYSFPPTTNFPELRGMPYVRSGGFTYFMKKGNQVTRQVPTAYIDVGSGGGPASSVAISDPQEPEEIHRINASSEATLATRFMSANQWVGNGAGAFAANFQDAAYTLGSVKVHCPSVGGDGDVSGAIGPCANFVLFGRNNATCNGTLVGGTPGAYATNGNIRSAVTAFAADDAGNIFAAIKQKVDGQSTRDQVGSLDNTFAHIVRYTPLGAYSRIAGLGLTDNTPTTAGFPWTQGQLRDVSGNSYISTALFWYRNKLYSGQCRVVNSEIDESAGARPAYVTGYADSGTAGQPWLQTNATSFSSEAAVAKMFKFPSTTRPDDAVLVIGMVRQAATFSTIWARLRDQITGVGSEVTYAVISPADVATLVGFAANAGNGFVSFCEYGGNLYASLYNKGGSAAIIKGVPNFNILDVDGHWDPRPGTGGITWSLVYTKSGAPALHLEVLTNSSLGTTWLVAWGGTGTAGPRHIAISTNGSSFTDVTAKFPTTNSAYAIPIFVPVVS